VHAPSFLIRLLFRASSRYNNIFPLLLSIYYHRNDLWALGCTLYQMLSGTSPFKDASEWLIFQRIIAREIRFPDYFSDEARDLIDRLLVSISMTLCTEIQASLVLYLTYLIATLYEAIIFLFRQSLFSTYLDILVP